MIPTATGGGKRSAPDGGIFPIRVRFVGAEGGFNSVATQAVRIHNGLQALHDPLVKSDLVLLPRTAFASRSPLLRRLKMRLRRLSAGVDILVVVKSSLFLGFDEVSPYLKASCAKKGIVLVSAPADGAAGRERVESDSFSERVADFVLTISQVQQEALAERRDPARLFAVGTATRPSAGAAIEVRDRVRTVVWENPPHHDPQFNPERNGIPIERYQALERRLADLCARHGAVLSTFGNWRDEQTDEEWQRLMLAADVAIECKSLEGRYTPYQLAKPAVKLRNYLSLGLPTICDSLPAHLEVGRPAGVLFADTEEQWEGSLLRLFESRELRAEMSAAALEAAAPYSIASVSAEYVEAFRRMLAVARAGA